MKTVLERIEEGGILVGDGAMGSLLMSKGLPIGACPESFNLSHLKVLEEIAALYFNAGADIIQTNTFGGSPLKLSNYSLEEKTEEINSKAVLAVRNVVGDKAYVSASCGPSGKLLKPYGDVDPEEMYNSFFRQLSVLIDSGVDIICIETMIDVKEAVLATQAARSISPSIPIMSTMTFDKIPRGFYTVMGVNIESAVKELEKSGANIIGSNCGNGIENMIQIAKEFKKITQTPLIIQANAGIPELKGGEQVYPETPGFMAEKSKELVEVGVSIIGGCCGTTPEHVHAIRQMVDSQKS